MAQREDALAKLCWKYNIEIQDVITNSGIKRRTLNQWYHTRRPALMALIRDTAVQRCTGPRE
jgi:hypothetical protein